jgi:hypothetical protein
MEGQIYIVVTKHSPPGPVIMKTGSGGALVGFNSREDGAFYLNACKTEILALKPLPDVMDDIRDNPNAHSRIYQILYFNTRSSVELFLQGPDKFPYVEFLIPLPKI